MRAKTGPRILSFTFCAGLLAVTFTTASPAAGQASKNSANRSVQVSAEATVFDLGLKKLGTLKPGTSVDVLQEITDRKGEHWLKVRSDLGIGYVRAENTNIDKDRKHSPTHAAAGDGTTEIALPANPAAVLEVGLRLVRSLEQSAPGDNVAVSPYGLWSNARLWLAGARGETRERLLSQLQFDERTGAIVSSEAFTSADRILKRPQIRLQPEFAQFAEAAHVSVDDSMFDEQARVDLNSWIADQSRGRIKNFYSRDQWDSDAALILLNVCTLDAKWKAPFDDQQTADAPFYSADGAERMVRMMVQQTELSWISTDDFSGVMLPYQENELAAIILLPTEGKALDQMTETLSGQQAHKTLQSFREELVLLLLPKFEMNTQIDLFEALNIKATQGGAADFSGISEQPVEISGVQQQVSLAVDAEGTTAAATTATQFGSSSVGKTQPKVLQCNRPFLFMVVHQPSLTPLFLSAIKHPTTPGNEQRSAK